jgi:hypothetical protein
MYKIDSNNIKFLPKLNHNYNTVYSTNASVVKVSVAYEDGLCFPLTACKDYLQEFFMIEHHLKKGRCTIYGFTWEFNNIIKDGKVTLVYSPCNMNIDLNKQLPIVKHVLNYYSRKLGLTNKVIVNIDNNLLTVTVNEEWLQKPALVSLLSVLVRYSLVKENKNIYFVTKEFNRSNNYGGDYGDYNFKKVVKILSMIRSKSLTIDQLPKWNSYSISNINKLHNYSGIYYYIEKIMLNEII